MQELREVSDEWLAEKSVAEKGFSLGYFDEAYLRRFPIAVIEREGRIEAFANLWRVPPVESEDLMRHRRIAPSGVMEEWSCINAGVRSIYSGFAGMAPLSGFEQSRSLQWNRLGAFIMSTGRRFYNFQGLRAYKRNHPSGARYLGCQATAAAPDPRRHFRARCRRLSPHLSQVSHAGRSILVALSASVLAPTAPTTGSPQMLTEFVACASNPAPRRTRRTSVGWQSTMCGQRRCIHS